MKNSEIAEGALEVIEEKGWTRDAYGDDAEGYCLMGAGVRALVGTDLAIYCNPVSDKAKKVASVIFPGIPEDLRIQWTMHVTYDKDGFPVIVPIPTGDHEHDAVAHFNDDIAGKADAIGVLERAAKYWRDKGE